MPDTSASFYNYDNADREKCLRCSVDYTIVSIVHIHKYQNTLRVVMLYNMMYIYNIISCKTRKKIMKPNFHPFS